MAYVQALSMAMAVFFFLFFVLVFGAISVLWVFPLRMKLRLQRTGLDGPPPKFLLGNWVEMRERSMNTAPPSSSSSSSSLDSISHDIHFIVQPHFAFWRKIYGELVSAHNLGFYVFKLLMLVCMHAGKVFVYWLGTEPFLYVADPETLKQLMSGAMSKKWGKPNVFKHDRKPMFGKGLLMAEGDDWSHHRHVIAPALSVTNLNVKIFSLLSVFWVTYRVFADLLFLYVFSSEGNGEHDGGNDYENDRTMEAKSLDGQK